MNRGRVAVVDVGKTHSKVSLWDVNGRPLAFRSRANSSRKFESYRALDVDGIDRWLIECLREFAGQGPISHLVPVGHGAAAALIREGQLFVAPMDYEDEIPPAEQEEYRAQRDPFTDTGSPALPNGLNLGMQLHRLEHLYGPFPESVTIVTWPQYWAWRFCGVAASEVSSLGCHTDLWCPVELNFSTLARRRGWSRRMAPLRFAGDSLGRITPQFAAQTGLSQECLVLCGMHDSNAALHAVRAHPQISQADSTVLSTGTWFVAMGAYSRGTFVDMNKMSGVNDCLINVDILGQLVPSARFMGGREVELIMGNHALATSQQELSAILQRLQQLIAQNIYALPTFTPGVGPFANAIGAWRNEPSDPADRQVIASMYLALVSDELFRAVGSHGPVLIEGRFAADTLFVRALATLRPRQEIFITDSHQDVAYGALRLVAPAGAPQSEPVKVEPLDIDLSSYAAKWRNHASSLS